MNIIEAFQKAETGALITNGMLKRGNHFLRYVGDGVFHEYEVIQHRAFYQFAIRNFSFGYIIMNDWEVVDKKYDFENE